MLDNTAEAAQSSIWTGPCFEPGLDGRYDAFKLHKVLIVQAAASDQHPDSLNRVEFGAVGTRDQILMMQQQPTAWIPLPKGIQILTGNESRHRYRPRGGDDGNNDQLPGFSFNCTSVPLMELGLS